MSPLIDKYGKITLPSAQAITDWNAMNNQTPSDQPQVTQPGYMGSFVNSTTPAPITPPHLGYTQNQFPTIPGVTNITAPRPPITPPQSLTGENDLMQPNNFQGVSSPASNWANMFG